MIPTKCASTGIGVASVRNCLLPVLFNMRFRSTQTAPNFRLTRRWNMIVNRMKQSVYIEGQQATENFEEGMKALFKVPKDSVAKPLKKREKLAPSERKPKNADKD